jgi:hypothetical protein
MRKIHLLAAVCACLAMLSPDALAAVVFAQTPLSSGGVTYSDTESGFQAFDDFSISENATVSEIYWYGQSIEVPDSQQYEISFYLSDPDISYYPGMLYSQTVLVSPVVTRDTTLGLYVYTASIPPLMFAANTKYWLSIKQDGDPDYTFGWQHADLNQDLHAVLDLNARTYSPAQNDLAFTLLTEDVPGDINNDTRVDVIDVLLAIRIVLNQYLPTDAERARADIVQDNQINAGDVVRIQQLALGL